MFDDAPESACLHHYKELEAIGLAAPQVTYLMHETDSEKGIPDMSYRCHNSRQKQKRRYYALLGRELCYEILRLGQYYPADSVIHKLDPETSSCLQRFCLSSVSFRLTAYVGFIVMTAFLCLA